MRTIRWGLIGCGDVARKRVATAIISEPHSRLIAACRRNPAQLADFCRTFEIDRAYTDADKLLADPDVDAVYIATPVCHHLSQSVAAAMAGKHVLVEKPMAMNVAECDQMVAACRSAGVRLGVAYYRRFYPAVARISELLHQGTLGTPLSVTAVTCTTPPLGPAGDLDWRLDPNQGGGGSLMDIGSHRIDLFLHLFGDVTDVKALTGNSISGNHSEQTALVLLRFASGVMGTIECHFGRSDPDEFTILGTAGRLEARPLNKGELSIETADGRRVENDPPCENFNAPLVADFVQAILENRQPLVSGSEGRATNEIMQRAYHNAHVREP